MISAPSGKNFTDFLDFAKLITNPTAFEKSLKEFNDAAKDFAVASKKHDEVLKIVDTTERADAILAENVAEQARLNVLSNTLEEQNRTLDTTLAAKEKKVDDAIDKKEKEIASKDLDLAKAIEKHNGSVAKAQGEFEEREAKLNSRESYVNQEEARLKAKKERVDAAFS